MASSQTSTQENVLETKTKSPLESMNDLIQVLDESESKKSVEGDRISKNAYPMMLVFQKNDYLELAKQHWPKDKNEVIMINIGTGFDTDIKFFSWCKIHESFHSHF